MERASLRIARARRGWTLEQAAEHIGVGRNTLCRWEQGQAVPYPYNIHRICKAYGMTAMELGLEKGAVAEEMPTLLPEEPLSEQQQGEENPCTRSLQALMRDDLELRLQCLIYDWQYRKTPMRSFALLQRRLAQEIESDHAMPSANYPNHETVDQARRDALRRLALVPLQALGLGLLGPIASSWAPEDILTHCAAGITACEHLAKGVHEDMALASYALSAYLPTLKTIVKQSSVHRKQAAGLAAQALHTQATLSVHTQGPGYATSYAEQGIIYSKESGDLLSQLSLLKNTAWVYSCDRQSRKAAEKVVEAQHLLEQASVPIPILIQSCVYSTVAKNLSLHGQKDEALNALRQAHDTFSASSNDDKNFSYMDADLPHLFMNSGYTYYHLGQHDQALAAFAQIVDTETLTRKIPGVAERIRIEIINHQALALLKQPEKDMELTIKLWKAGMKGAIALRSEQRFSEALSAYQIMEALWPHEKKLLELRELTQHW